MTAPRSIDTGVLILGGGIVGLWTLRAHLARGHDALLLETVALGAGQTGWSQGIIHGGIKYALTGEASAASRAIADMPARWHAALNGQGDVALSPDCVLTDRQMLWTTGGILSRLAGVAASKAIRTPVEPLAPADRPPPFDAAPKGVSVYSVAEPVLHGEALVRSLAQPVNAEIVRIGLIRSVSTIRRLSDHACEIAAQTARGPLTVRCRHLILAAGAGNESLLNISDIPAAQRPRMQRRPLHMAFAMRSRENPLPRIFGHCLAASTLPRLTITSTPDAERGIVWTLGGALSESGVQRSADDQIAAAREELRACLPWLDLVDVRITAARIDRAEGQTHSGGRPDVPVISRHGPISVAWPTKLAFAPLVSDRLLEASGASASTAAQATIDLQPVAIAPPPFIAHAMDRSQT